MATAAPCNDPERVCHYVSSKANQRTCVITAQSGSPPREWQAVAALNTYTEYFRISANDPIQQLWEFRAGCGRPAPARWEKCTPRSNDELGTRHRQ